MCSQEAQGERERRNERERTEKSDDDEIQHRFFATEVLLESFGLRFFFLFCFFVGTVVVLCRCGKLEKKSHVTAVILAIKLIFF